MSKFKAGDMIKCVWDPDTGLQEINDSWIASYQNITIGKFYKVLYNNKIDNIFWSDKVWIINDKNIQDWFFARWFVGIKEERNKKLNKIKNLTSDVKI